MTKKNQSKSNFHNCLIEKLQQLNQVWNSYSINFSLIFNVGFNALYIVPFAMMNYTFLNFLFAVHFWFCCQVLTVWSFIFVTPVLRWSRFFSKKSWLKHIRLDLFTKCIDVTLFCWKEGREYQLYIGLCYEHCFLKFSII